MQMNGVIIQPSSQKGKTNCNELLFMLYYRRQCNSLNHSRGTILPGAVGGSMNILLVGGNAELQAESSNALQLALGDEVAIRSVPSFNAARRELQRGAFRCHEPP